MAVFSSDLGAFVQPKQKLKALKDDADNRILECAIAGDAHAIVAGDRAFLALREFRGVRVIDLRDYVAISE